jgi:hypothetical protein
MTEELLPGGELIMDFDPALEAERSIIEFEDLPCRVKTGKGRNQRRYRSCQAGTR